MFKSLQQRLDGGPEKIRYDTIEQFNVDSKAGCDQLNLAHETKTNKRQRPLTSVQIMRIFIHHTNEMIAINNNNNNNNNERPNNMP